MKKIYLLLLGIWPCLMSCDTNKYVLGEFNTIRLEHLAMPTEADLNSIFFVDEQHGFIAGDEGKIFRTTDAGNTWQDISRSETTTIRKILFISTNIGFIILDEGKLLKTTDAGNTWEEVLGISRSVQDIHFTGQTGYVITYKSLWKTTDEGDSWTETFPRIFVTNGFSRVFALSQDTVLIGGKNESIYRTFNGGRTVTFSEGRFTRNYSDLYAFNNGSYYTVGAPSTLEFSRTSLISFQDASLYSLSAIDFYGNRGMAVGNKSVFVGVYSPGNDGANKQSWLQVFSPEATTILQTYHDVAFANANDVYAVGQKGIVTRFKFDSIWQGK